MPRRYLDANHGTEIPTNLIFVDTETRSIPCETHPEKRFLTLRLWVAVHVRLVQGGKQSHTIASGSDQDSFWQWLDARLQSRKKTWLFAHNANFDLTQLDFWEQLDNGRYTVEPMYCKPHPKTGETRATWRGALCLESSPFFVCCRQGKKTLNIVDTTNYWRMPLAELGESFDLPKLEMPSEDAPDKDWEIYCHRDVEILVRAVVSLLLEWSKEDCGVFQMTAAMLSLTSFRHMCQHRAENKRKLDLVCDQNSPAHDLERQAYYGGQVICYFVGERKQTVYHVDVNSLYPHVMREHAFPRCYEYFRYNVPIDELAAADGIYGLVAECLIKSRAEVFPVRVNGQFYNCTGDYWTTLSGPELSRALRTQCVSRTARVQYYSIAAYFREWIDYWYSRKVGAGQEMDHRGAVYHLAKIVLNSLSGKFAQHGKRWIERPGRVPVCRWGPFADIDDDGVTPIMARGIAGNMQVLKNVGEPRYAFPAISAFITSHGREYMRAAIELAGIDNVFYQAVDALIVSEDGMENLVNADLVDRWQLGKFKIVGEYDSVEIRGANYYKLGDKVTASGLIGLAERARAQGKNPEVFEPVGSVIAKKPDGTIAVSPLSPPTFTPDYRGTITQSGQWMPYRVTFDPEWTDRPPRSGWQSFDSLDKEQARILLAADV